MRMNGSVITAKNLQVPLNAKDILINCGTAGLS
jgi:hypothetical protein